MDIEKLLLKPLAHMFLPSIIKIHNCGFNDGGCWSFAQAIHLAFEDTTQTYAAYSSDGTAHHGLIKVIGKDLFGDADGWHSYEQIKQQYLQYEHIAITKIVPINLTEQLRINSQIKLFMPIISKICNFIHNQKTVVFDLPIETEDLVSVSCNLFDRTTATLSSKFVNEKNEDMKPKFDVIEKIILGHFKAGVDVLSGEYCKGIMTTLLNVDRL